jgi:pyruvate/2-oxoglutarate dehydrogenase complex dihydrolipoamide dehydrogenase (E3) component
VDDRLRTSNSRIYAAGDICSRYKFTHAADAMARIVIANTLFFARRKVTDLVIPWCTYTDPEIAHVGYYEKDAKAAGFDVATITQPLSESTGRSSTAKARVSHAFTTIRKPVEFSAAPSWRAMPVKCSVN